MRYIKHFNTGRQYAEHGQVLECVYIQTINDEFGPYDVWAVFDMTRGIHFKVSVPMSHFRPELDQIMSFYDRGAHTEISSREYDKAREQAVLLQLGSKEKARAGALDPEPEELPKPTATKRQVLRKLQQVAKGAELQEDGELVEVTAPVGHHWLESGTHFFTLAWVSDHKNKLLLWGHVLQELDSLEAVKCEHDTCPSWIEGACDYWRELEADL